MRVPATEIALLALPTLINAVALSDMTPRASNLPSACNNVYTQQISGCTDTDFSKGDCSSTCLSALYALQKPIQDACGNDGLKGENLVVAFLAGVGPQQLCHNAPPQSSSVASSSAWSTTTSTTPSSTTTQTPTTTYSPTIVSSITTASSASDTSSLLVDTSSTMSQTMLPSSSSVSKTAAAHKSHKTQTAQSSAAPVYAGSSSLVFSPTTTTSNGGASQTSSSSGSSQTDLNDGSGGGSPFDTPGNIGSGASGLSISAASILFSALIVILATVR